MINTFLPDSGGLATKMTISGENFGNDPSKIKVYFNEKPAAVVGAEEDLIYVITPRQPGELSDITVVIGSDSVVHTDKQFKYLLSATVSTHAGVVTPDGNGDYKDGVLSEAMFKSPRFVFCDIENNVFVTDNEQYVRLISEETDQVMTLADHIARPVGGCVSTDGKRVYVSAYVWRSSTADRSIYLFDPDKQWNPVVVPTYIPRTDVDWVSQMAIDEDDNIYFGAENGNFFKVDTKKGTWEVLHKGVIRSGDYSYSAYSKKHRRVYVSTRNACDISYYDLDTGEYKHLAGGGRGYNDGPGDEAQFNNLSQIAVDLDGNVIVADRNNHCIRMIRPDGFTSTVAGVAGTKGYMNGDPAISLFADPYGVCVSPADGAIYVADSDNYRIRKIVIE